MIKHILRCIHIIRITAEKVIVDGILAEDVRITHTTGRNKDLIQINVRVDF